MNVLNYFTDFDNWSLWWLTALTALLVVYMLTIRAVLWQTLLFALALGLCYLVFGSPLNDIKSHGLHSIGMVQQIIVFMIVPVLLLLSLPKKFMRARSSKGFALLPNLKNYFALTWIVGALAMWGGHFISAAILSSKTGLAICGISLARNPFLTSIPENFILASLLIAGVVFVLPIFHPDPSQRIAPLKRVIYLFTSCVSCSVLGLYVVFSASSASVVNTVQALGMMPSPLPWSLHTDQELAGMIMWVPGCLLYVLASVGILLSWYDEGEKRHVVPLPMIDNHINN